MSGLYLIYVTKGLVSKFVFCALLDMGKTAKQLAGLRLLVKETLAHADEGPAWLERARRAVAAQ